MSPRPLLLRLPLLLLCWFSVAAAQQPAIPGLDALQGRLAAPTAQAEAPAEATRAEPPDAAREALAAAERYRERTARLRERAARAATEIAALADAPVALPAPAPESDLPTLEEALQQAELALASSETELEQLRQERYALAARAPAAQQELATAQRERQQLRLETDLQRPVGEMTPAELERLAQYHARDAQIELLQTELATQDARRELLRAQEAAAARRRDALAEAVAELQTRLGQQRQAAASEAAAQSQALIRALGEQGEQLRAVADQALTLADELRGVASRAEQLDQREQALSARLEEVEALYRNTQAQLEIAGLGGSLGQVLHQQRDRLPDVRSYRRGASERNEQIANAQLRQFQLDEQLRLLQPPEALAEQLLAQSGLPPTERSRMRQDVIALLREQQDLVHQLARAYSGLVSQLAQIDATERQLVEASQRYALLLDENLLWIASHARLDAAWPRLVVQDAMRMLAPRQWLDTGATLLRALPRYLPLTLLLFAALALWWRLRPALRAHMRRTAEAVGWLERDRLVNTVTAMLAAAALVAPVPSLMGWLGWLLRGAAQTPFVSGLGQGLINAGLMIFIVETYRRLARVDGVLQRHFQWQRGTLTLLHRQLGAISMLVLLSAIPIAVAQAAPEISTGGLARLIFMLASLVLAVIALRLFRPDTGVFAGVLQRRPGGAAARFRYLWFSALVAAPLALGLMAGFGYYYTAAQLQGRLFLTGWLLFTAVLLFNLFLRSLRVAQQRLIIKEAAKRQVREERRESDDRQRLTAAGEAVPAVLDEQVIDLSAVNAQVRSTLNLSLALFVGVGLYLLWADVLPALNIFNRVTLWSYTLPGEAGPERYVITLGSVGLAVLAVGLAVAAARNVPGLLEVTVLQRLSLDAGSRYAIVVLSRYLIAVIGVVVVVNLLRIDWGRAQWLVAALGVGLGFGLQEIVANFVSGLIILFERPIRVGDTVTVGDVTGTVQRIRIRATTIVDWDRKELIVPNKTFVTDRLINWTLSDPITRIVVPVGIAYGSDTELARQTMMKVAKAQPDVLADPPPAVLFLGFGDSALNFEVRVFVSGLGHLLPTRSALHFALDQALREVEVEIAFPQRDLHLRSVDPALTELWRSQGPREDAG